MQPPALPNVLYTLHPGEFLASLISSIACVLPACSLPSLPLISAYYPFVVNLLLHMYLHPQLNHFVVVSNCRDISQNGCFCDC